MSCPQCGHSKYDGLLVQSTYPSNPTLSSVRINELANKSRAANKYWNAIRPNFTFKPTGADLYRQRHPDFVYWHDFHVAGTPLEIVQAFNNAGIYQVNLNGQTYPLTTDFIMTRSYPTVPFRQSSNGLYDGLYDGLYNGAEAELISDYGTTGYYAGAGGYLTSDRIAYLADRARQMGTYWKAIQPNSNFKATGAGLYRRHHPNVVYWHDFRVVGTPSEIVQTFQQAGVPNVLVNGQLVPLTEQLIASRSYPNVSF